jgi:hypothetical protein
MGDMKTAYTISLGTPEGLLGDLGVGGKIILRGVDFIYLAPDRDRRRTVVNMVINHITLANASFSRRTLLCGIWYAFEDVLSLFVDE